uniref:Beta-1,4-endoglucanase n=1 Tax=Serratia liquefaciens TaxID=614 RepID=S5PKG0_SERLI|nr:beta-1,4-endoglucanase [Serratia liquefaciens]
MPAALASDLRHVATVLIQRGSHLRVASQYKQFYISEQGRVIDPSSPNPPRKARVMACSSRWWPTIDLLYTADVDGKESAISAPICRPGWVRTQKAVEVLDSNSASDSDLCSYNLLEAGRCGKAVAIKLSVPWRSGLPVKKCCYSRPGADVVTGLWVCGAQQASAAATVGASALNGPWRAAANQSAAMAGDASSCRTGWWGKGWQPDTVSEIGSYDAIRAICGPVCWQTTITKRRCSSSCRPAHRSTGRAAEKHHGSRPVGFSASMLQLANQPYNANALSKTRRAQAYFPGMGSTTLSFKRRVNFNPPGAANA